LLSKQSNSSPVFIFGAKYSSNAETLEGVGSAVMVRAQDI